MSEGAGFGGRGSWRSAASGNCLMMIAVACFILVAPGPTPAVGPDLLHEEIGVDYDELAAGVEAAYAKAWSRTQQASRILFPNQGDEFAPDAAEAAMALYSDSIALIREAESRYSQAFAKIPLLFVQLEYLVVKNMSGMAAILSLQGDFEAAHDLRVTLIGKAEEHRARIAVAIARNILPQFHGLYSEVDHSFRQLLAESYVWMGVDAKNAGNIEGARAHYMRALELSDHEKGQEAIRVLLERLEFMQEKALLTADGKKPAPHFTDSAPVDGVSQPPLAIDTSDAFPVDAGSGR